LQRQPDLIAAIADIDHSPARDAVSMERMTRPRLSALLGCVRQAGSLPWDKRRARVNALPLDDMANWLPEAERDSLRAAFVKELERQGGIDTCPPPVAQKPPVPA